MLGFGAHSSGHVSLQCKRMSTISLMCYKVCCSLSLQVYQDYIQIDKISEHISKTRSDLRTAMDMTSYLKDWRSSICLIWINCITIVTNLCTAYHSLPMDYIILHKLNMFFIPTKFNQLQCIKMLRFQRYSQLYQASHTVPINFLYLLFICVSNQQLVFMWLIKQMQLK